MGQRTGAQIAPSAAIKTRSCFCSSTSRHRPIGRGFSLAVALLCLARLSAACGLPARVPSAFQSAAAAAGRREAGRLLDRRSLTVLHGVRERTAGRQPRELSEEEKVEMEGMKDRKKRRMGLVFGYVGTEYYGLQKSTNPDVQIRTIESVLEKALHEAGYIRSSNYGDLEKIGWARCSRTDKGVHAARNVVSAKLELKLPEGRDELSAGEEAVEEVNALLPDDLRVFSCSKVTGSFRPRDAVSYREYEYILPISMLRPVGLAAGEPWDQEAAIRRFFAILSQFQGTHSYHNFTKLSSREISRKIKSKVGTKPQASKAEEEQVEREAVVAMEDDEEAEDEETEAVIGRVPGGTVRVAGVRRFNTAITLSPLFELLNARFKLHEKEELIGDPADRVTAGLWDLQKHNGVLKMVRSNLYVCEGRMFEGDERFIAVSFHGQSFLYNMIRLIIGSAVGVTTGVLPADAVQVALNSPYLIYSPLAPAEGLYLRRIVFGRKRDNSVVLMPEDNEVDADGKPKHHVLMGEHAKQRAEAFEKERIITKILSSWTEDLVEGWRKYAKGFTMEDEVVQAMSSKYGSWRAAMDALDEVKQEKELKRREGLLKLPKEAAITGYRSFMPARFATDAIVKFRVKPGTEMADVQRALANRMLDGVVPFDADKPQLFQYIDETGVSVLMEEGRRLREEYEAAQEELQAIKRAGGETTPPPPQDDSDGDGKAA